MKKTTNKKPYPDQVWYTVEIWHEGEWKDHFDQFDTLREARSEFVMVNLGGNKAAIVKHRTSAEIVACKDFPLV
jgi:hypothetical protein